MDYGSVTKTILKLVDKSTIWESKIQIHIGDNESRLDISSAARGELSVTTDGATKQPKDTPLDLSICLILLCMEKIHGKS
jgi:hypothetical protein